MSTAENIVDLQRSISTSTPVSIELGVLSVNSQTGAVVITPLSLYGTSAARGINKEIWISGRTDGAGTGTAEDPFDGSTQAKLDALLPTIAANTRIHFGAGTFFTHGITFKEGWIIVGSGETETIIKLSPGIANTSGDQANVFIQQSGFLNYAEIRDLTTDCNAANQGVATGNLNGYLDAVMIQAKSARLINLTCLGIYGKPGEGFPIHIEHDGSSANTDFVEITNVKAIDPVGNMTVINVFDQSGGQVAGVIQNCEVSCSTVSTGLTAYGGRNWNYFSLQNNRCKNAYFGVTLDTEDFLHTDISGNNFGVAPNAGIGGTGISLNGVGAYENVQIHHNVFDIAATGGAAIQSHATTTTTLSVISNTIINHGDNASFYFGTGTSGLVSANTVSENAASTFPSGIKLLGNLTPAGTALYGNSGIATQADVDTRFDLAALQNTWSSTGYKVWDLVTTDDGANLKRMRLVFNQGHFQIIALNDNLTEKFTWLNLTPDGIVQADKIYTNSIKLNTGQYINLSPTEGDTGYGFRDNAGVVEVKNSGGVWSGVNATVTRTTLSETATLTLPVGSDSDSTASGTLTTIAFSGTPNYSQPPTTLRLLVTGGPYTLTIPTSWRGGETSSTSSVTFQNGNHELSWLWSDGKYWLEDTGDSFVAVTSSGLTMATARILGRTTASTGAIEEITVGSGLSLSAGTLTATGGGSVDDTAYNATTWDAVTTVAPSKNAVRDKFQTFSNVDNTADSNKNVNGAFIILGEVEGLNLIAGIDDGSGDHDKIAFDNFTAVTFATGKAALFRTGLGLGTMATQAASAISVTGGTLAGLTGLALRDTSAAHDLTIGATSSVALTGAHSLTIDVVNGNRTIKLGDDLTVPSGGFVSDTAYDATSWDAVTTIAPSKNAVRDKIQTLAASGANSDITALTGLTTPVSASSVNATIPRCVKYTVGFATLKTHTGAASVVVTLGTIPANSVILDWMIKHSVIFDVNTVGIPIIPVSGSDQAIGTGVFSCTTAVAVGNFEANAPDNGTGPFQLSVGSTSDLKCTFDFSDSNPEALTTGSVDIWFTYLTRP